MIRALRKRHRQIWIAIAVLLPVGMISAWLVVPKPVRDHLWQPASSFPLPVVLKSVTKDPYDVSLRTNGDRSALQLEWINKQALTAPSAIIYELPASDDSLPIERDEPIGRIDARGMYHFPLKKDSANPLPHFILYDIIHHQVIDRINF